MFMELDVYYTHSRRQLKHNLRQVNRLPTP